MRQVEFANTGETVSEMCIGAMNFGKRCEPDEAERVVATALDQGVNFIDTAAMYGDGTSEEVLAASIEGRRDRVFLVTKVHKGIDGKSIRESIEESLSRLQTDHVDLYLIHWPQEGMRPAEVMDALNHVVVQGKSRYVGCCNYPAWLFAHSNFIARDNGWAPLVCNQLAYNPVERGIELENLPQALAEKVAITAYRPLLGGLLTGKYSAGGAPLPEGSRAASDTRLLTWLVSYGDELEKFSQLAIAWVRKSVAVTAPIVGVSSLSQLKSSMEAFRTDLSQELYDRVCQLFPTQLREEGFQRFPGLKYNFPRLRRSLKLGGE